MVPPAYVGSIAARVVAFMSFHEAATTSYTANTVTAATTLQSAWYNRTDGLWDSTGWWNSANILTTLADFAALDSSNADALNLVDVFANTYAAAQGTVQVAAKTVDATGLMKSQYLRTVIGGRLGSRSASDALLIAREPTYVGFINNFYDDEGWWALGLLHAYDVTGRADYLTSATSIFADMQQGVTTDVCGGGIWWSKDRNYKNAIANELYLAVAASLANRAVSSADRASFTSIATKQWAWFRNSGMINSAGTINDGLKIASDNRTCTNNNQTVFSYNQGVVLGGLVELQKAQSAQAAVNSSVQVDSTLLSSATTIAKAAMAALSQNGVLHDDCDLNGGSCGGDGAQFKGIFMRNLHYLHKALSADDGDFIRTYILNNADSIWANDRNTTTNQLGLSWSGPVSSGGAPTAGTHGSALDCLVAAIAVN